MEDKTIFSNRHRQNMLKGAARRSEASRKWKEFPNLVNQLDIECTSKEEVIQKLKQFIEE